MQADDKINVIDVPLYFSGDAIGTVTLIIDNGKIGSAEITEKTLNVLFQRLIIRGFEKENGK